VYAALVEQLPGKLGVLLAVRHRDPAATARYALTDHRHDFAIEQRTVVQVGNGCRGIESQPDRADPAVCLHMDTADALPVVGDVDGHQSSPSNIQRKSFCFPASITPRAIVAQHPVVTYLVIVSG